MIKIDKKIKFKEKKIFIITGKKSYNSFDVNKFFKFCNCEVIFYFKKNSIPEINELKKIIKKKNKARPDIIIGVGGGSVLDLSKMTASLQDEKIQLSSTKKIKFSKKSKLILIPTNAGSGAEATNFAVLYDGKKKYSLISNKMIPDQVFFYRNTLVNYNKKKKLSSALDILCQSIESMFSVKSNKKSLKYSLSALKILKNNMFKYMNNNKAAFKNMFEASNFAGKAINISKTNVPHALSYYFTLKFKVDHGYAVFLNFFGFLNFLYNNINKSLFLKSRFAVLFNVFDISKRQKEPYNLLFKKITDMIGAKISYASFFIDRNKELKNIVAEVNLERLKNSPIKLKKKDIQKIILFNELNF